MPIDFILIFCFVANFSTRYRFFFDDDYEKKLIGPVQIVHPSLGLNVHFKDCKGGGGSVFFACHGKRKVGVLAKFAIFLVICTGKIMLHVHFFSTFLAIFTPTFFLHAHFFFCTDYKYSFMVTILRMHG